MRHIFSIAAGMLLAAACFGLTGCGRPADNPLIGTWVVDKDATFAAFAETDKWANMTEQERQMVEPVLGPVLDNMTLTFTKTTMKQAAGAQTYETRYSMAARDEKTITIKIGSLMQNADIVVTFLGNSTMSFRGETPRDMDSFIWKRTSATDAR